MDQKKLNKIMGFGVFLITTIVYLFTVQSSVSFWDCGEFIASSVLLQVPHPPGTPLFLILGRFLSMIPFADNLAYRVNMISVFSSIATVVFLYLIIVKAIENYKTNGHDSLFDAFGTYLAAAIGALSLAFADTFWFNAVEAEVYALSTFFIAIVTYLIMAWNERADEPDNEKYLIMIAYLLGLSTGVHLMAVLAIVPITMVIFFRKYNDDEEALKKSGFIFLAHAGIIILIAFALWFGITDNRPPDQAAYKDVDQRFLLIFGAVSVLIMGIFWKKVFRRNSFYLPIMIGGVALVALYPGIVKIFPKLISSIGQNNITVDILVIIGVFAFIGYMIYWSARERKNTTHLVFNFILFALLGFTTYAMIIIRSNQDTPINLNSPKTFPELVKYLNREQYGDFPTWKRRYSHEPHQQGIYTQYSSDMDFLYSYQINHMFNRYLLWNYAGRESTEQDSGVDPSQLFYIPFLLGIFGVYFQFRRDWKMAAVFLAMFIFLGWLTAFYQNQQQPQPRERDYFYVGAFFVYSLWIGLGVRGIFDLIKKQFAESYLLKPFIIGAMVFATILVPFNMLYSNYFTHDRSRNYVPWDYSYNLLQSVAPNAILFTNGDNDTFPLWYLQDVEGVRRDVRIANLSLLNTPWYIKQLKNTEPHGAKKVPIGLRDQDIDRIGPIPWEPRNISIPVPENVYKEFGVEDPTVIENGKLTWTMKNTAQFGTTKAVRVQDLLALDIVRSNNWEVPVYFAVTCSEDSRIGLDDYLTMEGLAFRITPVRSNLTYQRVDEPIMRAQLFDEPDGYSFDYQPGFKYRGLDDSTIFFDENHRRLAQNYRNSYMRLALHYLSVENDNEKVVETLDKMEETLPRSVIPIDYRLLHDIGNIYLSSGGTEQYNEIANEVESVALELLARNPQDYNNRYSPYFLLKDIYENAQEWDKLVNLFAQLQSYVPQDPNVNQLLQMYKQRAASVDTLEITKEQINIE
jgi:transmembrane protein TMEM260 (protein O-mannosyltransferase)